MAIILYLAMTAAEFHKNNSAYPHLAWMACHFSSYGTGLSNIPAQLPAGSILMVNDRIPVSGHDPQRIAAQIEDVTQQLQCNTILLDFQRPKDAQTLAITEAITQLDACVAATPAYAQELDCGVLLPPIPLTTLPQEHLAGWNGRKIWLEIALETYRIRVDQQGNQRLHADEKWKNYLHRDQNLHCHYGIELQKEYVDFHLQRTVEDVDALIHTCSDLGVCGFIGLYQQFGSCCHSLAQDTALPQS